MAEKKEKERQGEGSFSDSAEMFDTLFRAELTSEKPGEEQPKAGERPLSDSGKLFASAFKEEIAPEKVEHRIQKKPPLEKPPQDPAKARRTPPPSQDRVPAQEPLKRPRFSAPAPAQAQPSDLSPSPPSGRGPAASPDTRILPQKPPRSSRKPLTVILPVLGVLVLAGAALFIWGVPEFFSDRGKPQPSAPPAGKEVQPPSPLPKPEAKEEPSPPSAPSQAVSKEEPAGPSVPPKPEVKEEPRPQPPVAPTPEKPGVGETEIPRERPAGEVAVKRPDATGPEQKALAPKAPSLPYSAFLGSFKDLEGVQRAVSALQKTGVSAYWFAMDLGEKGIWYRVYAGCFRTREEAEAFIQERRIPDASSRHTPHAALAGVCRTPEELETAISRLVKIGYGPYAIRQEDGSSYVYVGAFFQKSQAEALVAELAGKGIESRPAER